MRIEVVYSPAARELDRREIELPIGSRAIQAVEASGLLKNHPQLNTAGLVIGLWGRACGPDRALQDGDRVEIYRPLAIDPMEARRARGREHQRAQKSAPRKTRAPRA